MKRRKKCILKFEKKYALHLVHSTRNIFYLIDIEI